MINILQEIQRDDILELLVGFENERQGNQPILNNSSEGRDFPIKELDIESFKIIKAQLNTKNVLGNDWRMVAFNIGFKGDNLLGIGQSKDPAGELFNQWDELDPQSAKVENLIEILRKIKRNDVVAILNKATRIQTSKVIENLHHFEMELPTKNIERPQSSIFRLNSKTLNKVKASLNRKSATGNNWQTVAHYVGFKGAEISSIGQSEDPTEELFNQWEEKDVQKANVTELIKILQKMHRNDVIEILKKENI